MRPGLVMAYRQALEMTQKELADALGTKATTVSRWEQDKAVPPPMLELALLRLMDERDAQAGRLLNARITDDVMPATRPGRPALGAEAKEARDGRNTNGR